MLYEYFLSLLGSSFNFKEKFFKKKKKHTTILGIFLEICHQEQIIYGYGPWSKHNKP